MMRVTVIIDPATLGNKLRALAAVGFLHQYLIGREPDDLSISFELATAHNPAEIIFGGDETDPDHQRLASEARELISAAFAAWNEQEAQP